MSWVRACAKHLVTVVKRKNKCANKTYIFAFLVGKSSGKKTEQRSVALERRAKLFMTDAEIKGSRGLAQPA